MKQMKRPYCGLAALENDNPGPIRLHLIGQPLVGIEHGFDCAVEIAVSPADADADADAVQDGSRLCG